LASRRTIRSASARVFFAAFTSRSCSAPHAAHRQRRSLSTGQWITSPWLPARGCGLTLQTRSATCTVDAGSGTRSQTVTCIRSDGAEVAESYCDAESRPADTESCTPEGPVTCGVPPETERTVELQNGCLPKGCTPDAENGKYCVLLPF